MFLNNNSKPISLTLGLTTIFSLLSQFLSFRPIQDDYFILAAVSQQKLITMVQSVWQLQGGNVFPYAINGLLLESTKGSVDFLASRFFLILTLVLVILVSFVFIKWLGVQTRYFAIAYSFISLLAFEGIFSPLQVAAYSWHQTSITHLWPIALTVLAWGFVGSGKFANVGLLFCGLAVGNTNSAEALWAIIATFLYMKTFLQDDEVASRVKRINLRFFLSACILGFILTVSAPGFWNRANNAVGMPHSIADFGFRLAKSASAFGFDVLTHPYLWLAFLIGFICKSEIGLVSVTGLLEKRRFLTQSSFLLFLLLVLGTTLGYPAWHQALGLYVILLPTMFLVGVCSKLKFLKYLYRYQMLFFYICLIICLCLSLRSSILVINRAHHWDSAYRSNICSIYHGNTKGLKGAELVYPIFNKGIEDIQTWSWMKDSYVQWVNSGNSKKFAECVSQ